jgi:hypothetical protein
MSSLDHSRYCNFWGWNKKKQVRYCRRVLGHTGKHTFTGREIREFRPADKGDRNHVKP